MSGKLKKRPSSARRNISYSTFSSFVSCSRLRKIQDLLSSKEKTDTKIPEALLCILGIDSRYNDGCVELIQYLLFGFFENRRAEIERTRYEDEVIDDIMLLIKSDCVHVYCNPVNYLFLLPYIACWRNLHIHCLSEDKFEDEEFAEEFKIKSFFDMTADIKTIGIQYSGTVHKQDFNKMAVEKWPIIQAYALDEVGGRGFFTMAHDVIDMTDDLIALYSEMDPVSVEVLVTEQLPLFERQFTTALSVLEVEGTKDFSALSEGKVLEPLRSYFYHGRVGTYKKIQSSRQPFFLFGTNTSQAKIEAIVDGQLNSDSTTLNTGLTDCRPLHVVCQAVSPKTPLSCMRTYFLSSGYSPLSVKENMTKDDYTNTDISLLQTLYNLVVDTLLNAIDVYTFSLDISQASDTVYSTIQEAIDELQIKLPKEYYTNKKKVVFKVEAVDNYGRSHELAAGESSPLIKVATLAIYDVPSLEHPGKTLGSVVFSESFLEANIPVRDEEDKVMSSAACTVLTAHVPRYIAWPLSKENQQNQSRVLEFVKSSTTPFGRVLISNEHAHISIDDDVTSVTDGQLYIYEKALIFLPQRGAAIVLPKSELEAIEFFDGDSPSTVALLVLTYKQEMKDCLPKHLLSSNGRLVCVFTPKTRAYKAAFSEVLPVWRSEDQGIVAQRPDKMDDDIETLHRQLQYHYQVTNMLDPTTHSPLKKAMGKLADLQRFLEHFAVTSVGRVPISVHDLPHVLGQKVDQDLTVTDEILVTIIAGVPGSHKETLCNTLFNLNKENNRWLLLRQPLESAEGFSTSSLQASLTNALQNQNRRRATQQGRKQLRVLVCTNGYCDIIEVIQAIINHPNPEIAPRLKIGAVSVCVDPTNMFMDNRFTFPMLLDQCGQGFVNNIVFTGSTSLKNSDLSTAQEVIRAANPDVAFLLANKGEISRTPDIDAILSETAFMDSTNIRSRHLLCPGWDLGLFKSGVTTPQMVEICLKFSQSLERSLFMGQLRGLKSSLSTYPYSGNIYHIRGKLRFSDSAKLYEIEHITLTGSFRSTATEIQPTPPSANGASSPYNGHTHCVVFTGCGLQEPLLKDWLRACTKKKPEKKILRTKESLTKEEKKLVHGTYHLEPLPSGWFYNGTNYVCLSGEKSDIHPDYEEFIVRYLEQKNKEISEHNTMVDNSKYVDLFD